MCPYAGIKCFEVVVLNKVFSQVSQLAELICNYFYFIFFLDKQIFVFYETGLLIYLIAFKFFHIWCWWEIVFIKLWFCFFLIFCENFAWVGKILIFKYFRYYNFIIIKIAIVTPFGPPLSINYIFFHLISWAI